MGSGNVRRILGFGLVIVALLGSAQAANAQQINVGARGEDREDLIVAPVQVQIYDLGSGDHVGNDGVRRMPTLCAGSPP